MPFAHPFSGPFRTGSGARPPTDHQVFCRPFDGGPLPTGCSVIRRRDRRPINFTVVRPTENHPGSDPFSRQWRRRLPLVNRESIPSLYVPPSLDTMKTTPCGPRSCNDYLPPPLVPSDCIASPSEHEQAVSGDR